MTTRPDLSQLPPGLGTRPVDLRRGLPIPAVNVHPGGEVDFVTINGPAALQLAGTGRCSLCGQRMTGTATFLGGPKCAEFGFYSDPPMHEECAEWALKLCPHIARPHARRASERRVAHDAVRAVGFSEEKPSEWVLVVSDSYGSMLVPAEGGGVVPIFTVGEVIRTRRFGYQEGVLAEIAEE
ncbi:hypothetical protein HUT16_27445 [Kitasatospora sp. NA04385]|uniref:hypothetical protein n=1 Tax=Kitasatospora sp. NA04385 TaxID=2742135 RepID=UPI00158FF7D2|nr:hypothetical protein [Kitasatospora sp. NA04385]QKW22316.1 hypothetical protein HUT16_27445 [Kitasatospora sp. NA04385]